MKPNANLPKWPPKWTLKIEPRQWSPKRRNPLSRMTTRWSRKLIIFDMFCNFPPFPEYTIFLTIVVLFKFCFMLCVATVFLAPNFDPFFDTLELEIIAAAILS